MRRGIVLLSFFILLISMGRVAAAQTEGVVTVSVIGVAALSENEAETKGDALEDAFKKAVAKVVGSLVSRDVLEEDEGFIEWKIYSKAREFIVTLRHDLGGKGGGICHWGDCIHPSH